MGGGVVDRAVGLLGDPGAVKRRVDLRQRETRVQGDREGEGIDVTEVRMRVAVWRARDLVAVGHRVGVTALGRTLGGGRSRSGTFETAWGQWPMRHVGWSRPVPWGGPTLLATTPRGGPIALQDARDGAVHRELVGHDLSIQDMARMGDWLATSSLDGTVRLWRPPDQDAGWVRREVTLASPGQLVAGSSVVLSGLDKRGHWIVWRADNAELDLGPVERVELDPTGTVAAAASDGELRIVPLDGGTEQRWSTGIVDVRCIDLRMDADRAAISGKWTYVVLRPSDGVVLEQGELGDQPTGCATLDETGQSWISYDIV